MDEKQKIKFAVLVAALGYFVDIYDMVLFSIVRVESLKALGIAGDLLLPAGVFLLNMQLSGMLLGGIIWGICGDKLGRIQVLFGSILLYSLANLANAFVGSVEQYAVLRFIAGIGLAGEIGAGITLVSELMPKETRGFGTTIVATVGVSGAVVAALVGDLFPWRISYIIGGVLGCLLLALRISVSESGLFNSLRQQQDLARGDLRLLFKSKERVLRYLNCILIGLPPWFLVGILVSFSPEISAALGTSDTVKVSSAVLYSYAGFTLGDLASGLLSQLVGSRKKVIFAFALLTSVSAMLLLLANGITSSGYCLLLLACGFFGGYWAVFISAAAEQFGTNLRATVTTTVPNFVRGTTVLMTLLFSYLKSHFGVLGSAQIVCVIAGSISLLALKQTRETFGRDLDFLELDRNEKAGE